MNVVNLCRGKIADALVVKPSHIEKRAVMGKWPVAHVMDRG